MGTMATSGNSTGPPEATDLVDGSNTDRGQEKQQIEMAAVAVGEGPDALLPVAPTTNTPPLPLRYPPYPQSGKRKALREWDMECRRISKLAAEDPRRHLPTVIKPKDLATADSVASPRDKALVLGVGRSIVNVSSVALDGDEDNIYQSTGIIVSWNETKKCARILTSSSVIDDGLDHKPKLHVRLPNNAVMEGHLLFFNKHYRIALLEISSELELPLQLPSFGSNPNYGQEVFVLARGKPNG